ncbi:MAG TPA: VCBS repeat-containing protein [Candidatus Hydrogenedentes bacterium]|nr:VCBS repeat-containing protein [Candidatus Hydrogenedentota bacterium]
MLKFEKTKIADTTYEAASACDVNQDGILDIVSGEYWFEGPDFAKRHKICDVQPVDDYFDDFSDYPMDITGNGHPDIITGGWWGETLRWRENPAGKDVPWPVHDVAKVGPIERTCFFDIDGDGDIEVIPNTPGNPLRVFKLAGKGRFEQCVLSERPQSHGIGFGDITGNGRADVIMGNGFHEAPEEGLRGQWVFHAEFDLESASVPIIAHDVNGDGLTDLIVGQSHAYGLAWWEQRRDAQGKRSWVKHDIDPGRSQYHDLRLVDIDNDGEPELVTGKRYRAHCGKDPGAGDPIGLYYFKIHGGAFERVTLDYGPPSEASGAGIYFWVEDLDGNGWKDIIAPGKDGLYLFKNLGPMWMH